MKATILLALIATIAVSSGVQGLKLPFLNSVSSTSGADFGNTFLNYLKAFYNIMPCGYAPWKIPPVAPFTMANYNMNFTNGYYSLTGNLSNIVVTGLNDLRLMQFDYEPVSQKLTYDVIFYDIQMLAEYTMNAWVFVAGMDARVNGNGPLNYKIKDLRFMGDFVITTSNTNPNGLMMTDFNMKFLVGDVLPYNWNNKWDISFNNFLNRWVRELILMWSEQVQGEVNSIYDALVLPNINNALNTVNMNELNAFFTQQANLLNAAGCNAQTKA